MNNDLMYPNTGYPKELTERYGEDLHAIFGPKAERKNYKLIPQRHVEKILKNCDEALIVPAMRGGQQSMLATIIVFLDHMRDTKCLWGVELPIFNKPTMLGTELHPIEKLWINYRAQRVLQARHVLRIIFKYEVNSVFTCIGRMTTDQTKLFNNDGAHRVIASALFGMRYVAVQYCISDDPSVDVDQYCACNVDNLPSSLYDNFKNRKERAEIYIEQGKAPHKEDKRMYDLGKSAAKWNIKICRESDKEIADGPGGISHMPDLFKSFDMEPTPDVFNAAGAVLGSLYPNSPMCSANLLGLADFLSRQCVLNPSYLDYSGDLASGNLQLGPFLTSLKKSLDYRFNNPDNNHTSASLHSNCKSAVNSWWKDKFQSTYNPKTIPSHIKVSTGIYETYRYYSNEFPTVPVEVEDKTNKNKEVYGVLESFFKNYHNPHRTKPVKK